MTTIDKDSTLYGRIREAWDADSGVVESIDKETQGVKNVKGQTSRSSERVFQSEQRHEDSTKRQPKKNILTPGTSNKNIEAKQLRVGVITLGSDNGSGKDDDDLEGMTPAEQDVEGPQSTIEKYVFNPPRDKIFQATELYGNEISNFASVLTQEHVTAPWYPGKESAAKFWITEFCILRRSNKRKLLKEGVMSLIPREYGDSGFGERSNF